MLGLSKGLSSYHRGVEQWQLVGLITRRSLVRIQPPLPKSLATNRPPNLFGGFSLFQSFLSSEILPLHLPRRAPANPLESSCPCLDRQSLGRVGDTLHCEKIYLCGKNINHV